MIILGFDVATVVSRRFGLFPSFFFWSCRRYCYRSSVLFVFFVSSSFVPEDGHTADEGKCIGAEIVHPMDFFSGAYKSIFKRLLPFRFRIISLFHTFIPLH